jgi:hypothetical protein
MMHANVVMMSEKEDNGKKLMRKMSKCLILSASITGEYVLHYKHMERSVLALSARVPLISRWNMMKKIDPEGVLPSAEM